MEDCIYVIDAQAQADYLVDSFGIASAPCAIDAKFWAAVFGGVVGMDG
jgi:hypothetical protein